MTPDEIDAILKQHRPLDFYEHSIRYEVEAVQCMCGKWAGFGHHHRHHRATMIAEAINSQPKSEMRQITAWVPTNHKLEEECVLTPEQRLNLENVLADAIRKNIDHEIITGHQP